MSDRVLTHVREGSDDLPIIDVEYWDWSNETDEHGPLERGWVGAYIGTKHVVFDVQSEAKLFAFVKWLIDESERQMREQLATGSLAGQLDLGMQAMTLEGELNVRFALWPGVGFRVVGKQGAKAQRAVARWMHWLINMTAETLRKERDKAQAAAGGRKQHD